MMHISRAEVRVAPSGKHLAHATCSSSQVGSGSFWLQLRCPFCGHNARP